MKHPTFIVFEGASGTGKGTQIELLANRLEHEGNEVVCVKEPGTTKLGQYLRELLLHKDEIDICPGSEVLLFMASILQTLRTVIIPALDAGKVVISDRFVYSTLVYQGITGPLGLDAVWKILHESIDAFQYYWPIVTFILDLDVHEAHQRMLKRDERIDKRYEGQGIEYQSAIQEGYRLLHRQYVMNSYLINCGHTSPYKTIDEIHLEILNDVQNRFPELFGKKDKELQYHAEKSNYDV